MPRVLVKPSHLGLILAWLPLLVPGLAPRPVHGQDFTSGNPVPEMLKLFDVSQSQKLVLPDHSLSYDPNSPESLRGFFSQLQSLHDAWERHPPALPRPDKRVRRGVEAILQLQPLLPQNLQSTEGTRFFSLLAEICTATSNNQRYPTPKHLDLFELPFVFLDHAYNPMAKGRTPAKHLDESHEYPDHEGRIDPPDSSFWQPPTQLAQTNLYHGFGRTQPAPGERLLWSYDEPKTSYGSNPGFEVRHQDTKLKIKFGEVHSEPFAARLFHALGYHVDATDYSPGVTVLYDRRILTEFHSRKPIVTEFKVLKWFTVHTVHLQTWHDPFDHIAEAELDDGTRLNGHELRRALLKDASLPLTSQSFVPENFRSDFERGILWVRTAEANVQVNRPDIKSIGPWDFGQLDHARRRELRGAGLLAAWIGWCDSRFDNTRLKQHHHEDRTITYHHYFSDLGGGLGGKLSPLSWQGEQPNEFPWTFTRAWPQRLGEAPHPQFRIVNFSLIEDTPAFYEMTLGDARWMARWIARLTPSQILQALIGAGMNSAECRLYAAKLENRRAAMIHHVGLAEELEWAAPKDDVSSLHYDPAREGPVTCRLPDGTVVSAPITPHRIEHGQLVAPHSWPHESMASSIPQGEL